MSVIRAADNVTPAPLDEHRHEKRRLRFRSFRTRLMLLVAFAVSVPALLTCVILGIQLDRQARALFATTLNASLETFSLILQDNERNLNEGLQRAATDNTLQITLDLGIEAQLTKYIEGQRQVLQIAFFGVYDRTFKQIAFSSAESSAAGQWKLVASGKHGDKCTVTLQIAQQLVKCNDTMYLVSVVPINRPEDANLGDARARTKSNALLGYLLGGTPLAGATLIESLQSRLISHPVIWVDENLVYANVPAQGLPPPENTYQAVREFDLGNTAYLGAARVASVGIQRMTYAVLAPLAPLRTALLQSVFTVAGVGLFLVAATFMAGGFVTNRMLRPIRQLREGAANLGSGDLTQRISVKTGDELEALANQFNDMAERLQESYSGLEQKVAQRTAELSKSLEELRVREQQLATERERLRTVTVEVSEKNAMLESLSGKLGRYLPPQVYATIFSGAQDVNVVSQRKKLTVFFSDIVGFTETTDNMESEDLTNLLNQYLTEMSKIALDHGATIDKYIGDAVMIFFGDPESRGTAEDALACVEMAIAMQKRIRELAVVWQDIGVEYPLTCRIGIHTGYCTVGNFGSDDRVSYTAVGGSVNLASRLEHEAPPGGILISYETFALVKNEINCEKVGNISVKGIARPVATYRVMENFEPEVESEIYRARLPNFTLNLDSQRMTADEQVKARQILEEALDRLGNQSTRASIMPDINSPKRMS